MKEITLVSNTKLIALAIVLAALILGGAGVFSALQIGSSQRAVAESQNNLAEATEKASKENRNGLKDIGKGICLANEVPRICAPEFR